VRTASSTAKQAQMSDSPREHRTAETFTVSFRSLNARQRLADNVSKTQKIVSSENRYGAWIQTRFATTIAMTTVIRHPLSDDLKI